MVETGKGVRKLAIITMAFILAAVFGYRVAKAQDVTAHKRPTAGKTSSASWNFDNVPVGKLPAGWKVDLNSTRGPG